MPLQVASLGREVDVWSPRSGVVHSAFECAINLLLDGELWTVLGAARTDSPFGIDLRPAMRGSMCRRRNECKGRIRGYSDCD